MVRILGNATTGNVYSELPPVDLPRDTSTIRAAHKPWCVDCKRTGRELDTDQRCPQCARAAITRAEAAARRAAAEKEQRAAAKTAPTPATAAAATTTKPQRKPARPTPSPTSATAPSGPRKLPTEGKQGKPTTRSSAPRATSTSDVPDRGRTPGRAPGAGSSTTQGKNPPAAQETRPVVAGGPSKPVENRQPPPATPTARPTASQILDAQVDHAGQLLRSTASHPHPAVAAARTAVVAALEALHLLAELTPAAPVTPPVDAAAPRPTPATLQRRSGPDRIVLPADQIIAAYRAGQTTGEIAATHACSAPTISRLLEEHGIPRRGAPIPRSADLVEQVRQLYVDENLTQIEVGQRLGIGHKVVQSVMTEAGIDRRPAKARQGADNAKTLKQRIAELDTTAAEIKLWAIAAGHLPAMHRGLPARALVEKFAAAHAPQLDNTAQPA
ncbi:hypothetical protein [Pimelobacter simplex]|uniref:hypothetical protein n=1 Tax=Nocardioides simplex TaxID=2045 RepID=UPI00215031F3|nr:hypothetical protein [Pimelobacter simplex]UUW88442.1 hypothetical protein M0M43_22245 [Pimelobacter simplex]UUW97946.1 hypothetical protein M0M48_10890 [Pimelobacter simplex]